MYNPYNKYPCPNYRNSPWYNADMMYDTRRMYPLPYFYPMYSPEYMDRFPRQFPYNDSENMNRYPRQFPYNDDNEYAPEYGQWPYPNNNAVIDLMDYGPEPFAANIKEAAMQNEAFRTALWTGNHLQLTLMNLNPGEDIGLEMHPDVDQFVRIEDGEGVIRMGDTQDLTDFEAPVYEDFIFVIPAGKWHNLYNTGNSQLKLYSIYAPPQHPRGTVHETKEEAAEMNH